MMKEKVICSIIIPMYNGDKFIEETINSCLKQTIQALEIIIIDDCSKDNSYQIAQEFSKKNSNIIFLKNETNQGISKTVNIGATNAKGKYLLLLGHDDLLDSRHIEIMLKEFDDNTAFVHCNTELIDKKGLLLGIALDDKAQIRKNNNFMVYSSFSNIVSSTGAVVRRKYFDEVGGWDEKYRNYGEWLAWVKLANLGGVKYTTKVRAKYRRHDTNITNTFDEKNVKNSLNVYKEDCKALAIFCIKSYQGKALRASILLINSIKYMIWKIA